MRRIHGVARVPPQHLASAGLGNAISEDAQENKLRLAAEVANRVWPTGG